MIKEMSTESVSLDKKRMLEYKKFAVLLSYPEDELFSFFPDLLSEKEKLCLEYDKLFRANEVWLYGTEYISTNEFQKSNKLSDIMGFYRAFGIEPGNDRPDLLSSELEFMYYLIFKKLKASEIKEDDEADERASICLDAQKKFFSKYLWLSAKKISEKIISKSENGFYTGIAEQLLKFLKSEKKSLKLKL